MFAFVFFVFVFFVLTAGALQHQPVIAMKRAVLLPYLRTGREPQIGHVS